jgi:hypothetical protein
MKVIGTIVKEDEYEIDLRDVEVDHHFFRVEWR